MLVLYVHDGAESTSNGTPGSFRGATHQDVRWPWQPICSVNKYTHTIIIYIFNIYINIYIHIYIYIYIYGLSSAFFHSFGA